MRNFYYSILLVCFTLFCGLVSAQKTSVSGLVTDAETGEALPFVNVFFTGTKIGTTTNMDGYYKLESYYAIDSISASFVGYRVSSFKIKKDIEQSVNFKLSAANIMLNEVIIKPDKKKENPAHPIVRGIIRNKKINNRDKLEAYEYEVYNKVEFDLNNLTEEFMNKKVLKPFDFVFDNVDSVDGKKFLPLFITESVSDYYYRKDPKSNKEIIKATKVSGVQNESVSQFLGDMYQNINVYHNNIRIFGKNFVSPISSLAFGFYKFYLTDSAFIGNNWCYRIDFKPKRKQELTFEGNFWVNDTTYAIKNIEADIAKDANINFVNSLKINQKYEQVEKEVWMLVKDDLLIDFNLAKKTMGFFGRKHASYKQFKINEPQNDAFYKGTNNVILLDDVGEHDNDYWKEARHDTLTEAEEAIYTMVETIKDVPQFKTFIDVISLVISGYQQVGKFDLGPYFNIYSFNLVEGHRFRVGARTGNTFSDRIQLSGYGAYGLTDKQFKYGGGIKYFIKKDPRILLSIDHSKDVELLGQSQKAFFQTDNVLSSAFRRNPISKLTMVNETKVNIDREWFYGFRNAIMFRYREMAPLGTLVYKRELTPTSTIFFNGIVTSEVSFYTRFAYKERYVNTKGFNRITLRSQYPSIEATYVKGIKGLLKSSFDYDKVMVRVSDRIRLGPLGNTDYIIQAGKYWGVIPYPLLEVHTGNETFISDPMAFNTMNNFEFVSDEYVQLMVDHHFEGIFLNKVPLFRKLKWREVVTGKAVIGSLNGANRRALDLSEGMHTLGKPFAEASVGIENIFKLFRVDALWRLSYLDHPNISKFGFRMNIKIDF